MKKHSAIIITYRTLDGVSRTANTNPIDIDLQNATNANFANSLMVVCRIMIRLVLNTNMKMNEKKSEPPSHKQAGLSARRSLTVMIFIRYKVMTDAPKDMIISSRKISFVLKYLLRYLLRSCISI